VTTPEDEYENWVRTFAEHMSSTTMSMPNSTYTVETYVKDMTAKIRNPENDYYGDADRRAKRIKALNEAHDRVKNRQKRRWMR
jgi:hypothetical protein